MRFNINYNLLQQSQPVLSNRKNLFWIIGGAGSGKTTICQSLSAKHDMTLYDMDAHIYGIYHERFTPERHPVNTAWATAENGLAWLLTMSWAEFNNFNQAALPEYLDLLAEDIAVIDPNCSILIDGGISNPALLAQAFPAKQIVCLANPELSSQEIWEASPERLAMKEFIHQLPNLEQAWQTFLNFDANITQTMLKESQQQGITICSRSETDSVATLTQRVTEALGT